MNYQSLPNLNPQSYQFYNQRTPLNTPPIYNLPPINTRRSLKNKYKKKKKSSNLLGNNLFPMMMAMNSISKPKREPYSADEKIEEMFRKQNQMMHKLANPQELHRNRRKEVMRRIEKLERKIEEVL